MKNRSCFALSLVVLSFSWSATWSAESSAPELPAAPAREIVLRACAQCHPIERVVDRRRTESDWNDLIGVMLDRGAQATEEEQIQILDYLVRHFGIAE